MQDYSHSFYSFSHSNVVVDVASVRPDVDKGHIQE